MLNSQACCCSCVIIPVNYFLRSRSQMQRHRLWALLGSCPCICSRSSPCCWQEDRRQRFKELHCRRSEPWPHSHCDHPVRPQSFPCSCSQIVIPKYFPSQWFSGYLGAGCAGVCWSEQRMQERGPGLGTKPIASSPRWGDLPLGTPGHAADPCSAQLLICTWAWNGVCGRCGYFWAAGALAEGLWGSVTLGSEQSRHG